MASRIERALMLLRDTTIVRLRGDTYQAGLVDMMLEELDAEGGYSRKLRADHSRVPSYGETPSMRKKAPR